MAMFVAKGLKPHKVMMDSIEIENAFIEDRSHGGGGGSGSGDVVDSKLVFNFDNLSRECTFFGPEIVRTRTWRVKILSHSFFLSFSFF